MSPAHNHPLEGQLAIIKALRKGVQLGFASLPEQWDVLGYLPLSASGSVQSSQECGFNL
jgi:hypothetical protein